MANRASIKPFLMPYCEQIGEAIGTNDISEIIAVIVLDHKRRQCGCRGDRQEPPQPSSQINLLDELSELIH